MNQMNESDEKKESAMNYFFTMSELLKRKRPLKLRTICEPGIPFNEIDMSKQSFTPLSSSSTSFILFDEKIEDFQLRKLPKKEEEEEDFSYTALVAGKY